MGHLLDTTIRCFRTIRVGTSCDRKDGFQNITVPLRKCQLEINPPRSVCQFLIWTRMAPKVHDVVTCRRLQRASEEESSPLRMRLESFRGYGQRDREKENYTIKKILPVALVTEKDRGQHFVVLVILT